MSDITRTASWQKLQSHYARIKDEHLRDMFQQDPKRAETFALEFEDLLLDYSKNRINAETMTLLCELAREAGLEKAIGEMFSGKAINETEKRAVLHVALRNRSNRPIMVDGEDVMPGVNAVLKRMADFCEQVSSGSWLGYSGKPIRK